MIHIIDEYYVDGGANDFTLTKKTNSVDKKGNPIYRPVAYCSSVAYAVETVRQIKCRELTAKENMEHCTVLEINLTFQQVKHIFIQKKNMPFQLKAIYTTSSPLKTAPCICRSL